MKTPLKSAIESAKRYVIGSLGRMAHVIRSYDGPGYEVQTHAEYEESGTAENRCVASVWSYADGRYDSANVFHENGKVAAAVETY